jgi:hypothetical protein
VKFKKHEQLSRTRSKIIKCGNNMTNNINYFYGLKARNQPIVTKYIAVISAI